MDILSIFCPSCGAPAKFDIEKQMYRCSHCDGTIQIEEVIHSKKQIRDKIDRHLRETVKDFSLKTASCSGCGATLVFEENEALSNCAFCGRSLVREKYTNSENMPQSVIPFALTKKEAAARLLEWCAKNKEKEEARKLQEKIPKLQGYYLPYRLVQGPVKCNVKKKGETVSFTADGYLTDEFVNCSQQLDNLLLDAMEPYDLNDLKEFEFAFVAGQHVKVSDINEQELTKRLQEETSDNYRPKMEKIWGTKGLEIKSDVIPAVEFPVLLPVYYIAEGDVQAAVNGQTGKVSVKAKKESKYIDLPWWIKGLAVLAISVGVTFLACWLAYGDMYEMLPSIGMLSILYLFIFCAMFDGASTNRILVTKYREIFTTGEAVFRREQGRLVPRDEILKRKISDPIFMKHLDGEYRSVMYRFRSLPRIASWVLLGLTVIFLPVIFALLINGFNFSRLNLAGSAVWFLITIVVVPIYFIQLGIKEMYKKPWVYIYTENGKMKRYREKIYFDFKEIFIILKEVMKPPFCFIVLVVLFTFCMMVYLTAFGW